jgi:hypothetical protein
MLDEFDRGFNVRFTYSPASRFVPNKSVHEQFSQTANTAASVKRIELEITELRGFQAQVRASEESTVTQSQVLNAPYDGPVRGKIMHTALDTDRLTAFELGRLAEFRVDSDNFSTDSCSGVIKSRASIFFFVSLTYIRSKPLFGRGKEGD